MSRHIFNVMLLLLVSFNVMANEQKLSSYDVGRKIMSFHDTYQEAISETCDEIIFKYSDPVTRTLFQTIKVFYTHSSLDIASSSDSAEQLLDMLIMLRLQRLVWHDEEHSPAVAVNAELMSGVLKSLEKQLHALAKKVFHQSEIDQILNMAERWKKQNPDREYIAFVRFTDMDDSKEKAQINAAIAGGWLFSTISETNVELEESRHLMEKALFVTHHMPILLQWQSELMLYKMLSTQEIRNLLSQSEQTTEFMAGALASIEKMPSDIDSLLDKNKKDVLKLAHSLEVTSQNLNEVSEQLAPLFAENEGSPDDLARIQTILNSANETALASLSLVKAFNDLSYNPETSQHVSSLLKSMLADTDAVIENRVSQVLEQTDSILVSRLNQIDGRLETHRQTIFYMLLFLTFLFPVVFFTGYVIAKKVTNKS